MSFESQTTTLEMDANSATPEWTPPDLFSDLDAGDRQDLIDTFLSDTAVRLRLLRKLLADANYASARAEAHAIKGAAYQIALAHIASLCRETELYAAQADGPHCEEKVTQLERAFATARECLMRYSCAQR